MCTYLQNVFGYKIQLLSENYFFLLKKIISTYLYIILPGRCDMEYANCNLGKGVITPLKVVFWAWH